MQYEIKLDVDSKRIDPKAKASKIANKIKFLSNIIDLRVVNVRVFETGKGYHIYIDVDTPAKFDAKDITFLQLLLQSDWKREVYNWLRARADVQLPNWNVLFQIKFSNNKVTMELESERAVKLKYWLEYYLKAGDSNEKKEAIR